MAWLYVQASAASNSDSNLSSEIPITPSVTCRGKPMLQRVWSREWRKDTWIRLLSGTTLQPSTASRGVESWISSLRDIRVNPSASLEKSSGRRTPDTFGPRLSASSKSANQNSCSSKTSMSGLSENLIETFETCALRCRTPTRSQPPKWVQDILDGGSLYLPTATATTFGTQHGNDPTRKTVFPLENYLKKASDWKDSRISGKRKSPRLLPTLSACSYGTNQGGAAGRVGKVRPNLSKYLTIPAGGKVNPNWKDWYMGFPIGWTAIGRLATQSFQSWLRKHSLHSPQ